MAINPTLTRACAEVAWRSLVRCNVTHQNKTACPSIFVIAASKHFSSLANRLLRRSYILISSCNKSERQVGISL